MSTSAPELSVIVPTYNRRDSVVRLLESLDRQTMGGDRFEVIVVSDGATDGTTGALSAMRPGFRLELVEQANGGRAAACNAGIRRARGAVLVILDDDMEASPGLLEAHLRAHRSGGRIGVLGAVPIPVEPGAPPVVRYVAAKFGEHLERLREGLEIRFRSFYSGNFSIRREVMEEVGLYDEAFRVYGNEDTELSLRLLRNGVQLRYEPEALARQHYEKDLRGLVRDNFAKGRTAVLAARKHPEEFGPFAIDSFRQASGKWHRSRGWMAARGAVVWLGRALPLVPALLVRWVVLLERFEPRSLGSWYGFVIDCHFWLGVEVALRGERDGLGVVAKSGTFAPAPESGG